MAAQRLLETDGLEGLSMRALARGLGVAAPSLYFHVESRDDLLRLLVAEGLRELAAALNDAAGGQGDAGERIKAMLGAYAAFAFANPQLFSLIFGPCGDDRLVDERIAAGASAPLFEAVNELVPPERVLDVAQALWSLAHGYATLALADQFRMGGQPENAMYRAVDFLLHGIRVAEVSAGR